MLSTIEDSSRTLETAKRAFERHRSLHTLGHYTGILSLHGMARLAVTTGDPDVVEAVLGHFSRFVAGKHVFNGNFPNYLCGGNGTALLLWQGYLPEAEKLCRDHAEQIMNTAPRDPDGLLCMPNSTQDRVWIDTVFAVTPFLLFTGLALDKPAYVEEAYRQVSGLSNLLRDPDNRLLHQARGFAGPGVISQDHWSRGNGWALLAMAELVAWLPAKHALRESAEFLFMELLTACLCFQDKQGMFHQELTEPKTSYVETSGTGLILFALGVAIEQGLVPDACRRRLLKGLRSYSKYIDDDGSIHHTCVGCLCPGSGSIEAYKQVPHKKDDPHAFGPVILAFGQAHQLGITLIEDQDEDGRRRF